MDRDTFWNLIQENVDTDDGGLLDVSPLAARLASLPAEEILEFQRIFTGYFLDSYSWELWGAAYLINGGCSDDGFDYFRGWLIASGRTAYESAVGDPDSLADLTGGEVECEEVLYAAQEAYRSVAGRDLPAHGRSFPDLGEGWDFDDEDEMKRRYPRLFAKFG